MQNFIKLLFVICFLLLSIGSVAAYTVNNNMPYKIYYKKVNDITNPTSFTSVEFSIGSGQGFAVTGNVFYYSKNENFSFASAGASSTSININEYNYNSLLANTGVSFNWLTTTKCIPSVNIVSRKINANYFIIPQVSTYISFLKSDISSAGKKGPEILNDNYYMIVDVRHELRKNGVLIASTNLSRQRIAENGLIFTDPYLLQQDFGVGSYTSEIIVEPVDLKCDFNNNGILDASEILVPRVVLSTYSVVPVDSDNDGVTDNNDLCPGSTGQVNSKGCSASDVDGSDFDGRCDVGSLSDGTFCTGSNDLCPGVMGEVSRGGCPEYVLNGQCTQLKGGSSYVNFDGNNLRCNYEIGGLNIFNLENYFNINFNDDGGRVSEKDEPLITYEPDQGTQTYVCWSEELFGDDERIGYCDLTYYPELGDSNCIGPNGDSIESGTSRTYYSKNLYQYGETVLSETRTCTNGNLNGSFQNPGYFQLSADTQGTRLDHVREEITYDDYDMIKTKYDLNSSLVYFTDITNTTSVIALREVNESKKNIKIIRNGVLLRVEAVDPAVIALHAHKIRKYRDANKMKDFVDSSSDLMQKFDIIKNLTYNNLTDKTKVRIQIENVPTSEQVNLTIYKVISKSLASSIDDINFISDGGAKRIILDKDPVIGWYFNDSDSNSSIEYEVDGDTEGGTIVITQEPILYNEGELIINYREGGCNSDEAYLFDLDDLENSNIYAPGSGKLFKVCIAHLTETLYADSLHSPAQHIFTYTHGGNVSIDESSGVTSLDISVDQTTPKIYWDMKVQDTNPSGNYSCLGSVDNEQNSLFGDCGFTLNRIWLHLGADYFAPNTTLSYPYLSHSVRVELDAKDNVGGSGVDKTYYCYDDYGTCNATTKYDEPFTITCEYDWGCVKYVRFYSTDIEGNIEELKTQNIRILDKGSACSADCTAKPSPNRFLKECRNLNGCTYYSAPWESGDSNGEYVAQQCDFLIKDSWVSYNETHDIKCPNGPLRMSIFTQMGVDNSLSNCINLIKTPYIALFDGQQVIMNVLSCAK